MKLFYVSTSNGCGIRAANSKESAERAVLREVGTDHLEFVRPATVKDVEWVRGMGWRIPEGKCE